MDEYVKLHAERIAALLRQVGISPILFEDAKSTIMFTMFSYLADNGISLGAVPLELDEPTTETLERAYENGWAAVINDGKLLGFKKETPGYCE